MKSNLKKAAGFTSIEIVLVVVAIVIVASVGYLVYKDHNKPAPAPASTSSNSTSSHTSTSSTCPASDTTTPNSYNVDSSDSSVTCALAYGQQMSNSLQIDNGVLAVVSAFYASKLGSTSFNGEAGVANLMIKNVTTTSQSYDLSHLVMQLPNGQQVKFNSIYGENGSTVSVASSGTAVKAVVFSPVASSAAKAGQGQLIYNSPTTAKPTEVVIILKAPYSAS